jgi:myo-inositol-1(or 4)-monophosphatase
VAPKRSPERGGYLDFAHDLADISAAAILPYFRRRLTVSNKASGDSFDPVTAADRAAEKAMRAAIEARFPDHGIVGEEFPERPASGSHRWLLDPIDGTRAFIMGSPMWGTLLGLTDNGVPRLGLMNQPFTGERFWAAGKSAHMRAPDGRVRNLSTRACQGLSNAVLTTTHPDLFASKGDAAAFKRLRDRARMTRFGGDCYGYCLLAAGFVDLVVEAGLKPYDIVPLIPIIEGAGGCVTTWEGEPATHGGRILASGDARLHEGAMKVLRG